MKKINIILILLLVGAIIIVLALPKKEKKAVPLQREAPPPQVVKEKTVLPPPPPEPIPVETPLPEKKIELKVNFYLIDPEKGEKGEFIGSAELSGGKLDVNVTAPGLREILEKPYSTMAGKIKEGVAMEELVTYQPGTLEHLQTIAIECLQFGYIGEIEE